MAEKALAHETLCALRQVITQIETGKKAPSVLENTQAATRLSLGVEAFDAALEGGLCLDGMNELRAATTMDSGAASGFALALAALAQNKRNHDHRFILWISEAMTAREAGLHHGAGFSSLGIDPARLVHATPRKLEDALWICETALSVSAFSAIILEVRGNPARFGLTESRRLHLRATKAGMPLFLLRQAGEEEASSAMTRLRLAPAPASKRWRPDGQPMPGSIGNPVFQVTIEKSRLPGPACFYMEWKPDECQFHSAEHSHTIAPDTQQPAHSGNPVSASLNRSAGTQALGAVVAFDRAS